MYKNFHHREQIKVLTFLDVKSLVDCGTVNTFRDIVNSHRDELNYYTIFIQVFIEKVFGSW